MPLGTLDRTPPPFFRQGPSALTRLTIFSALALFLMVADTRFEITRPVRAAIATVLHPIERMLLVPVAAWEGKSIVTIQIPKIITIKTTIVFIFCPFNQQLSITRIAIVHVIMLQIIARTSGCKNIGIIGILNLVVTVYRSNVQRFWITHKRLGVIVIKQRPLCIVVYPRTKK